MVTGVPLFCYSKELQVPFLGSLFLLVLPLWRFASEEGTPGAGDNLASSLAALEMARVFSARRNSGQGLKRTRVIFVSFDAEEAGLRGARAYAEAHRGDFKALPTYAFNMDCVYTREKFRLLLTDINGTVKLDEAATRHLIEVGKERDLSITTAPIVFLTGGTDAGELAKAGVRTVSLMGMDWSNSARSSVYHTPGDRVEAIEPVAVMAAIDLGVNFILTGSDHAYIMAGATAQSAGLRKFEASRKAP